jgi:hypothetical protein
MPTLTSSVLAEKLNQANKRKGLFFMPFSPNHAERVDITTEDVLAVTGRDGVAELLEMQSQMGPAVTAFLNMEPVAIFGFVSIWRGVAETWLVPDEKVRSIPMTLTRIGMKVMDITMISMGLHRIQLTVRTTDKRAEKWAYAIGFKQEGVLHKYGADGVDYLMMARTR